MTDRGCKVCSFQLMTYLVTSADVRIAQQNVWYYVNCYLCATFPGGCPTVCGLSGCSQQYCHENPLMLSDYHWNLPEELCRQSDKWGNPRLPATAITSDLFLLNGGKHSVVTSRWQTAHIMHGACSCCQELTCPHICTLGVCYLLEWKLFTF
jgi:hypothetical protein